MKRRRTPPDVPPEAPLEAPAPYAAPPPPTVAAGTALDVGGAALTVTIPAGATRLWLWWEAAGGAWAYVRGVVDLTVTPPGPYLFFDFEAPFGTALTYYGQVANNAGETSPVSAPATIALDVPESENPWLVDVGNPNNSQQVVLEALAELEYDVPVGVHKVIGRRAPIVLSDIAPLPALELVFVTETPQERERARATLGNGIPFELKTPPEQGVGIMYLSVISWTEQRPSRLALHDDRRFRVQAQQVDPPDPQLVVPVATIATYLDIRDGFDDYADVEASRSSYQALMVTYGGGEGSVVPWPPEFAE